MKTWKYLISAISVFTLLPLCLNAQDLEVPYVATPPDVVEEMLRIAGVGPGDYVIDLGSGDGRIVIEAAKKGALGHGVDLDEKLVEKSYKNAEKAGVADRVQFFTEDIFETDFSMASVITIYMSNDINRRMRPLLLKNLEPGTRIVSHIFHMGEWQPYKQSAVNRHNIYLWKVPADVEGTWRWQVNGKEYELSMSQKFQEITETRLIVNESVISSKKIEASLKGGRITIMKTSNSHRYVFNGVVSGGEIKGSLQIHDGEQSRVESWQAQRN